MKNSPRRDLEVFEYEEEVSHGNMVPSKNIIGIPCINDDTVDCDIGSHDGQPQDAAEETWDEKEKHAEHAVVPVAHSKSLMKHSDCISTDHRSSIDPEIKTSVTGVSSLSSTQSDFHLSDHPSSDGQDNLTSDDDACTSRSSPSSSDSEGETDALMDNYTSDQCLDSFNQGISNMEVVLYPDYVIYQENYYMGPQLTFSSSSIKIDCLHSRGKQGCFSFERAIDDLVDIKCQLYQSVETVMIKLHVMSNDEVQQDNSCGTSGIEELKIAVVEPNWSLKYREITSLNVKYMDIWDNILVTEMGADEDDASMQSQYFPVFDEPFEEVIYPHGDPDAVSISKRDVNLLQPDTFVNDTIIDFYIKYLKNQIPPQECHRFHFFNSFFFRKLVDMDKNPSSASDGKAAFLRVRKWTRKVNLFEKDYIFIPVNFNLHWSLMVICHPVEVVRLTGDELDNSSKMPCILHMDSIKGSHSGLKDLVQSYLCEEWKERNKEAPEDLSSRFLNMRFVSLELPQQENSYDCGLFLLHYLELFLADAPVNFNPFKITKFSNFLNADWFPPAEVSLKRTLIERLIFKLLENRSREVSSSGHSDDHQSPKISRSKDNDTCVEFLSDRFSPQTKVNPSSSFAGDGIHMTLLSAASSLNPPSVNNSGMVLRELLDTGGSEGSLIGECKSFHHRSTEFHLLNAPMFPIEEDSETGEQFMYLASGDANLQQMAGTTSQTCALPYLSISDAVETSYASEIVEQEANDSSGTSDCTSDDSGDLEIVRKCPVGMAIGSKMEDRVDDRTVLPMENRVCLTEITGTTFTNLAIASVVQGSQDSMACNGSQNGALAVSSQNISVSLLNLASHSEDDKGVASEDVCMIDEDLATAAYEEQAAKRMRLTPPTEC